MDNQESSVNESFSTKLKTHKELYADVAKIVVTTKTMSDNDVATMLETMANQIRTKGLHSVLEVLNEAFINEEDITSLVDIKGKSLQNLAIARLQKGQVINGYAYEQKFGDRKWRDDVDPSLIQMMTGIDIIKPTVLSPAQAEKAGVHKSIIAGMVTKPSKGLDLVKSNNLEKARKVFGG